MGIIETAENFDLCVITLFFLARMARRESRKSVLIREIFKPAIRKFERRHVVVKGLADLIQMDLIDMRKLSRFNDNLNYGLVAINAFSKYSYVQLIPDKRAPTVRLAADRILDASRQLINAEIRHVMTDDGSEFKTEFQNMLRARNINGYISKSKLKCTIVERFNRTLKLNLFKAMAIFATKRYLDLLPQVMHTYNHVSRHRTTKMTPFQASQWENEEILRPIYNKRRPPAQTRYRIGDWVRIVEEKTKFSRGWHSTFSPALYRIVAINRKRPVTFRVADYYNNILPRSWYESEIQRTRQPNYFLVERIVQRRGNRALVKWVDYDSDANSWIDMRDFIDDVE